MGTLSIIDFLIVQNLVQMLYSIVGKYGTGGSGKFHPCSDVGLYHLFRFDLVEPAVCPYPLKEVGSVWML